MDQEAACTENMNLC